MSFIYIMVLGFIIIRHVNSEHTNRYWKECYTCIRKFYNHPIMIIDDSSHPEFLIEDIPLVDCTVIYDKEHKGVAELLPYYYFHLLKPFDTAVILHDSVFIQQHIEFELENQPIRFLWTIPKRYDVDLIPLIEDLCSELHHSEELINLFYCPEYWTGSFGAMSVITWDCIDNINATHDLFNRIISKITSRDRRSALERVIGILASYHSNTVTPSILGSIHEYIKWGISFEEYQSHMLSQSIKSWTGHRFTALLASHDSNTVTPTILGSIPIYIKWEIPFDEYKSNIVSQPIIKVWTGR